MAVKKNKYDITARLVIISSISITADSYEDAVAQSKDLKVTEFVTIDGEYIDGSIRISSVSQEGLWKTDDY